MGLTDRQVRLNLTLSDVSLRGDEGPMVRTIAIERKYADVRDLVASKKVVAATLREIADEIDPYVPDDASELTGADR